MSCHPNAAKRLVNCWQVNEQGCDWTESIPVAQNFHVARRQVAVNNILGLHLRAADKFVRLAKAFQSDVKVRSNGNTADGRSILDLLRCPTWDCRSGGPSFDRVSNL